MNMQMLLLVVAVIIIVAIAIKRNNGFGFSDASNRTTRAIKNYQEVAVDASMPPFDALMAHIKNNAKRLYSTGNFEKEAVALWKITEESARPLLVLVMGEFKTGKSTFVNLLLKDSVLKTDAAPATAVVSLLRYGDKKRVVIHKWDETTAEYAFEKLAEITAEGDTAKQKLRDEIEYVEIFYPNEILKSINFVDTPGLNVHNVRHIKSTENFQQKADLVLWVFNATRTAARTELSEIAALGNRLKPLAIVNRMDAIDLEEETPEEVLDNIRQRLGDTVQDVIGISALQAKTAMNANDNALLVQSGWTNFYNQLQNRIIEKSGELKFSSFVDKIRDYSYVFSYSLNNMEIKLKGQENFFSNRQSAQAILKNKLSAFDWGIKQAKYSRESVLLNERQFAALKNAVGFVDAKSSADFFDNNNPSDLVDRFFTISSCLDNFDALFNNQELLKEVSGMVEIQKDYNLYENSYQQDGVEMRQWVSDVSDVDKEIDALSREADAIEQAETVYKHSGIFGGEPIFDFSGRRERLNNMIAARNNHVEQFQKMIINLVNSYFVMCGSVLKKHKELSDLAKRAEKYITKAKRNAEHEMKRVNKDFDKEKANYVAMQKNLFIGKAVLIQLQQAIAS